MDIKPKIGQIFWISPSEISSNCINFNHMLIKKFSDFFCLMGISSENVSFWVVTCFSATDTHHPLRAFQARQGLAETYSEIHHNSPKLYDHIKNVLPLLLLSNMSERGFRRSLWISKLTIFDSKPFFQIDLWLMRFLGKTLVITIFLCVVFVVFHFSAFRRSEQLISGKMI